MAIVSYIVERIKIVGTSRTIAYPKDMAITGDDILEIQRQTGCLIGIREPTSEICKFAKGLDPSLYTSEIDYLIYIDSGTFGSHFKEGCCCFNNIADVLERQFPVSGNY